LRNLALIIASISQLHAALLIKCWNWLNLICFSFSRQNKVYIMTIIIKKCQTHPGIKIIVDVHLHPSYKPIGRYRDAKVYFSGKHHEHGIKTETAHYPYGRCFAISKYYPCSTHDFTIFKDQITKYKEVLETSRKKMRTIDDMPLNDIFPNQWILIEDSAIVFVSKMALIIIA
jgi:hypothetical protein